MLNITQPFKESGIPIFVHGFCFSPFPEVVYESVNKMQQVFLTEQICLKFPFDLKSENMKITCDRNRNLNFDVKRNSVI